jgi:O-antigen/teichoic acid export membrane protein
MIALAISFGLMAAGGAAGWIASSRMPGDQIAVFYWGLVLIPLVALGNLRGGALRGLQHVLQGQLPEIILRPAILIVLILAVYLGMTARALTPSTAMMLHALASFLAFVIGAYLLLRARPQALREERDFKTYPRQWIGSAIPLGMVEGIYALKDNVGLIALGIFATSEQVGVFRVALQGAALVPFALTAANMVIAPHIARLHSEGRRADFQRLLTTTSRAVTALAVPLALIFLVFGKQLLPILFGSEFAVAYPALLLLTVGQLVNAVTGSVGTTLAMTGEERCVLGGNLYALLINVVLLVVFVPLFGPVGAAASTSIGTIFLNVYLTYQARRRIGISPAAI